MIKPHETETAQKFNLDAQKSYEDHIDNKICEHDFDTSSDLEIMNPPNLTLADRNAVLAKYVASYKHNGETMLGWDIIKQSHSVIFRRPVTRG